MYWVLVIVVTQLAFLYPRLPLTTTLEGDASEILAALATNGVIHSPGFPAYMTALQLFHKGFFFFEIPFVGALFSAVSAAFAGAVFFLILTSSGVTRPFAAVWSFVPLLCLEVWYQSQITEVYSFAILWLLLLIYFLLRNAKSPSHGQSLALVFLSVGGFSAHLYVWPFIPVGLWFAWRPHRQNFNLKKWGQFVGAALAGLSFLLYLPIFAGRSRYVNEGDIVSFSRFWDHITWKLHRERLSEYQEQGTRDFDQWLNVKWDHFWFFLDQIKSQLEVSFFIWVVAILILVILGGRFQVRKSIDSSSKILLWSALGFFALIWIVFAGSEFRLAILGEMTVHLIPFYYLFLLFVGLAVGSFGASVQKVLFVGTLAFSLQHFLANQSRMDLSENRIADDHGRELLQALEPNALLLSQGDTDLMSIVFQQAVREFRADVQMINLVNGTPWYFDHLKKYGNSSVTWPRHYSPYFQIEIIEQNIEQLPIYFSNYLAALMVLDRPQMRHRFTVRPERGLYRLILSREATSSRPDDDYRPIMIDDTQFALRGVEIDVIGNQKDYFLRRAQWEKAFSIERAKESVAKGLALPIYGSQFNQALHLELLKFQQSL